MAKKKQKVDWRVICMGLLCITALEICALFKGYDGVMLSIALMIIAGAIGVMIPKPELP